MMYIMLASLSKNVRPQNWTHNWPYQLKIFINQFAAFGFPPLNKGKIYKYTVFDCW